MTALIIIFMGAGFVALIIAISVLRGWVFSILWQWFAVPIFGLPPLGVAQAIGIAVIFSMLTHQYVPKKEDDSWQPIVFVLLSPLAALLIGWIARAWI